MACTWLAESTYSHILSRGYFVQASGWTLMYTPPCSDQEHRGMTFACFEAVMPQGGAPPMPGRKSIPRGCVYVNVTDANWPPAVNMTVSASTGFHAHTHTHATLVCILRRLCVHARACDFVHSCAGPSFLLP